MEGSRTSRGLARARLHLGRFGAALVLSAIGATGAFAAFVPVEDFDGLELGPIDGQAGWTAVDAGSIVALDPADGENRVLSIATVSTRLHRTLVLPEGATRMLFLRLRYEQQLSISFGMSDYAYPSQFGDFESELGLTNTTSELRVNDGGSYEDLGPVERNVWYNCWMRIDNLADETRVWLHARPGADAGDADILDSDGQTVFDFRSGTPMDLRTFFVKTGGGSGLYGPLFIDDIYMEDTEDLNLECPAEVQTGVAGSPAPSACRLDSNFPNPFNPSTEIRFAIPAAADVRIAVHDARGRLVAVLLDGPCGAGESAVRWDGTGTEGRAVGSGVYFARMSAGPFSASRRMLLLR